MLGFKGINPCRFDQHTWSSIFEQATFIVTLTTLSSHGRPCALPLLPPLDHTLSHRNMAPQDFCLSLQSSRYTVYTLCLALYF